MNAAICYFLGLGVGLFVGYRIAMDRATGALRRMLIERGARI